MIFERRSFFISDLYLSEEMIEDELCNVIMIYESHKFEGWSTQRAAHTFIVDADDSIDINEVARMWEGEKADKLLALSMLETLLNAKMREKDAYVTFALNFHKKPENE